MTPSSDITKAATADAEVNYSLLSAQMSWMRSDLSNLRTLLS